MASDAVVRVSRYVSTKCGPGVHDDCVTGPYVWRGGKRRVNRGYSEYCTCPCHLVSNHRYLGWVKQRLPARDLKAQRFRFWWRWW